MKDPIIRFWKNATLHPRGCWTWKGSIDLSGHARFAVDGKNWLAHKWIWELFNGSVPSGMELHHVCGVKHCVNQTHLQIVTRRDHILLHPDHLMAKKIRQTTCKNGHSFYRVEKGGGRRCTICRTETDRLRYLKKKAA